MKPSFITGLHKSGTTWLANLLQGHPELLVNYEGGFLYHEELLSNPARVLHDQSDDESLEHVVSQYIGRWMDKPWNHWCDGLSRAEVESELFRVLVGAIVGLAKPEGERRYWVDKTPRTPIARILKVFPDAQALYLLRDGRDRAISLYYHCLRTEPWVIEATSGLRRMHWDEAFHAWVHDVRLNEEYFAHPSCLLVRYEDLSRNPHGELERILGFLGVRADSHLCQELVRAASFQAMTRGRQPGQEDRGSFFRKGTAGDWRTFEPRDRLARFAEIAGEVARRYGYEI